MMGLIQHIGGLRC